MLISPIAYFGGKHRMAKKILQIFPTHTHYVEVFGGGGTLLLNKPPSANEVYNDVDSAIVDFFRVLQCPQAFQEFERLCIATPFSRELFAEFLHDWHLETERVRRVWKWFVCMRQSYGSHQIHHGKSFTWAINSVPNRRSKARQFVSRVDSLPEIHNRFRSVHIENQDFRLIIPKYDYKEVLFYLDPPYVQSTRKGGGYNYEMTDADHQELLDMIIRLKKAKVILSGYPNALYAEYLSWNTLDFQVVCVSESLSGNKQTTRTERVWFNFEIEESLPLFNTKGQHD